VSDIAKYSLADRPKWWVPKIMKWLSIFGVVIAILMWVASTITYNFYDRIALDGGNSDSSEVYLDIGAFASEAAWASIGLLFYVVVFWFLSLAIDKLDQLVWLNASDEDREVILTKRKNKNAKN